MCNQSWSLRQSIDYAQLCQQKAAIDQHWLIATAVQAAMGSERIVKASSEFVGRTAYLLKVKHTKQLPMAAGNILHFAIKVVDHFTFIRAAVSHIGFALNSTLDK